jgi:hypothetical protein
MQNLFKKHPLWSAIGAIVIFLLVTIPIYLGAIWPILEWARIVTPLPADQSLPQWITEQRWPGMTSAIFNWIVLGSVVGMFIFLAAIIRAVHQNRREVGWLETIADEDDSNMANRIGIIIQNMGSPGTKLHLHDPSPYMDLVVLVQNNTVYTLTLTHLEGTFDFFYKSALQSPLQHDPKIVTQQKEIKHAQHYKFIIRQYLQSGNAQQIKKDGETILGGGDVAICYTYKNRAGEAKPVRTPLNDLRLVIELG